LRNLLTGSGAARGGSFPPYGWTSKNYIICVLSLSWNFFVSQDKYKTLQIPYALQQICQLLGDIVLYTPYRPIPHFPRYKILAAPPLTGCMDVWVITASHSAKISRRQGDFEQIQSSEQHIPINSQSMTSYYNTIRDAILTCARKPT